VPQSFVWTVVCAALALLALAAWALYAVWVELRALRKELRALGAEQKRLDGNTRGLRQQVGNIIAMLLSAGFKAKRAKDWSDDGDPTVALGLGTETKWDWRTPDQREAEP